MIRWLQNLVSRSHPRDSGIERLVQGSLSMVVAARADGCIEAMSPPASTRLGHPQRGPFSETISSVMLSPEPIEDGCTPTPTIVVRADGSTFGATVAMTAVGHWPFRRHIYLLTDETTRMAAESREREASALLATVLAAVTDPIFVCDGNGRFLTANESSADLMGISADRLIGRSVEDAALDLPDWLISSLMNDRRRAALGLRRLADIEISMDGEGRWIQSSSFPLSRSDGVGHGAVTILRDVTAERRSAAAVANARDRAERADYEKSRFLAAASHDLRQPIQSMYLQLGILQASPPADKAASALERLARGMDTMKGLLDNLLDLRKFETGHMSPEVSEFDLDGLLIEVEAAGGPVAAEKGVSLRLAPCPGVRVSSDRVRLGQMIGNLVHNAIRYTDAGSVEVLCEARPERIVIEIRDTGIGIPAERIPHIWDEFVQLANPERDRDRGVGLGLSIVARLSRLLDHPVRVNSAPGTGSSFFVEVPVAMDLGLAASAPPHVVHVTSHAAGRTAVVIDDDDMVLTGLEVYLGDAGYSVVTADSAEGAIAELGRRGLRPDVIVADYRLRDARTGVDAILSLRAHVGDEVPAAILTGETDDEIARDVARAGSLLLLHKPMTGVEITNALRAIWLLEA